jgi:HSP20 family protein
MKLIRYEYPQIPSVGSLNRLLDYGMPALERFGGLFDDFFGSEASLSQPAVDLYEDDHNFFARMELPGVKKNRIDLELENAVLTCSGKYSEKTENAKTDYSFQRSISIPDGVALDQVSADYEDGILTVKMPKKDASRSRQIRVK